MTSSDEKTATTRHGRKPRNSQGGKPPRRTSRVANPRKSKPGRGTENLVEAVNTLLGDQSIDVAQALITKTKAGSAPCGRLLLEIAHESKPAPSDYDPQIAALNLPRPEDLEAEPQWIVPLPGAIWVGDHWQNPPSTTDPDSPTPDTTTM